MSTLTERIAICNDASLRERVEQALAEAGKIQNVGEVVPVMVKTLDALEKVAPYTDEDIISYIAGLS